MQSLIKEKDSQIETLIEQHTSLRDEHQSRKEECETSGEVLKSNTLVISRQLEQIAQLTKQVCLSIIILIEPYDHCVFYDIDLRKEIHWTKNHLV